MLIVTAIYAGELVWRERDTRIDDIADSMPAPTWLGFLAKFATLVGLQVALMLVVMVCSLGVQLAKGYTKFELGHYFFDLFVVQLPGFVLVAVLALTVHTLVNNKYLGHFLVLLVFLVTTRMADFGLEDRLYRYASRPDVVYSDLNGYGHFLPAVMWFRLYWGAFAVLLLVLSYALWVRGRDGGLRARLSQAAARMTPTAWSVAGVAAAAFAGTGAWIFYNTHVLNTYLTRNEAQRLAAEYEKTYKALDGRAAAEDHGGRRQGRYLPVGAARAHHRDALAGQRQRAAGVRCVRAVFAGRARRRDHVQRGRGARESRAPRAVASLQARHPDGTRRDNGAALRSHLWSAGLPKRGRRSDGACERHVPEPGPVGRHVADPEPRLRRKRGAHLRQRPQEIRSRTPTAHAGPRDKARHMQSALTRDADFIAYRATVCTSPNQLPVTSGYAVSDTTENGRRCIAYKMDTPMAAIYPFVSARYAVRKDAASAPDSSSPRMIRCCCASA